MSVGRWEVLGSFRKLGLFLSFLEYHGSRRCDLTADLGSLIIQELEIIHE